MSESGESPANSQTPRDMFGAMRVRIMSLRAVSFVASGVVAAVAGACAGGSRSPSQTASVAPRASAAADASAEIVQAFPAAAASDAPCVPASASAASLVHFEASSTHATLCYARLDRPAEATIPCLTIDPVGGGVSRGTPYSPGSVADAPAPPERLPSLTTTDDTVTLCTLGAAGGTRWREGKAGKAGKAGKDEGKECTSFKPGGTPRLAPLTASLRADGSQIFVIDAELKRGQPRDSTESWDVFGDVFDAKTRKRKSRILLSNIGESGAFSDVTDAWQASWVGANVLVTQTICCGPGGTTLLVDPTKGKALRLMGFQGWIEAIGDTTWLVLDGKRAAIVSTDSLTELSTFTLPGELSDDPDAIVVAAARFGETVLIAYASPPGWMTFDVATRRVLATHALAICART
jgi:hypothetical protein